MSNVVFCKTCSVLVRALQQQRVDNSSVGTYWKQSVQYGCFESFPFRQNFVIYVRQIT